MARRFSIATFLRNLKWGFLRNCVEDHIVLERRIQQLEGQLELLRPSRAEFRDLLLFEEVVNSGTPEFEHEADFCRRLGRLEVFPYAKTREFPKIEAGFDDARQLPFVVHGGKRLYYPANCGVERAMRSYMNSVAVEGLLAAGCLEKSPHNYLDDRFPVKNGAVVCDFGAAEGLVALHFAEQASKIVIGECDGRWMEALRATFEPYTGKTIFVTNPLGMGEGTCARILAEQVAGAAPAFLKFDIEGAERFAIREARMFFTTHPDVTVACAAYHRQDDAEVLEKTFKEWGYKTAFSDGAMLFLLDQLAPPYFRRGVLHAKKG